jgi:hypothetical protein
MTGSPNPAVLSATATRPRERHRRDQPLSGRQHRVTPPSPAATPETARSPDTDPSRPPREASRTRPSAAPVWTRPWPPRSPTGPSPAHHPCGARYSGAPPKRPPAAPAGAFPTRLHGTMPSSSIVRNLVLDTPMTSAACCVETSRPAGRTRGGTPASTSRATSNKAATTDGADVNVALDPPRVTVTVTPVPVRPPLRSSHARKSASSRSIRQG